MGHHIVYNKPPKDRKTKLRKKPTEIVNHREQKTQILKRLSFAAWESNIAMVQMLYLFKTNFDYP